jgi:hypothetical protein
VVCVPGNARKCGRKISRQPIHATLYAQRTGDSAMVQLDFLRY